MKCNGCNGEGWVEVGTPFYGMHAEKCPICNGTGEIKEPSCHPVRYSR